MDFVHQPQNHTWISEKINLNEYFTQYQELVQATRSASAKKGGDLKTLSAKNIKKLVETVQNNPDKDSIKDGEKTELDDELYDQIEALCDIDNLTIPNEVQPMQQFLDPSQSTRSQTSNEKVQYPKFQVYTINLRLKNS